jgi:hypothetical protein
MLIFLRSQQTAIELSPELHESNPYSCFPLLDVF